MEDWLKRKKNESKKDKINWQNWIKLYHIRLLWIYTMRRKVMCRWADTASHLNNNTHNTHTLEESFQNNASHPRQAARTHCTYSVRCNTERTVQYELVVDVITCWESRIDTIRKNTKNERMIPYGWEIRIQIWINIRRNRREERGAEERRGEREV
jgi:hypothetical protein